MGKVDELMALARDYALVDLRQSIEAALRAEYERGRSERYTGTPKSDPDYEHSEAAQREHDAEPVAWAVYNIKYGGSVSLHLNEFHCNSGDESRFRAVPLYAAPPKRRPLTDHISGKYNELLLAVGNKYPGESRHETALRYIMRAERANESDAKPAHGIGDE